MTGAEGCPDVDPDLMGWVALGQQTFSTWPEANLIPVFRYLRGNKHLVLHEVWADAFPRSFEILNSIERQSRSSQHDQSVEA